MTAPGPVAPRRAVFLAAALIACVSFLGACSAGGTAPPTFPPVGASPAPAGDATAAVRAEVAGALSVEGLQVVDATVAVRPPEGAIFASAPRTVIRVVLPDDPTHGYIVLYAFASPAAALAAAKDEAAYIASGPGNVQFTPGTQFTLRVSGTSAVFFSWVPDNAPDTRTPSIPIALSQVGVGVDIPS
jgi:hypothetical protein